ncbi:MAG: carboxypeptidase-like regulatory domain-containing protein [Polyangiales bacterium]
MRAALGLSALLLFGCGGSDGSDDLNGGGDQDSSTGFDPDTGDEGGLSGEAGDGGGCTGLKCQQVTCTGGKKTTVSGVVHDPAGKVPLYNVVVYVPNAKPAPLVSGASCDKCADALSGSPIVVTLTDTNGKFSLPDVPVGKDIPLVIQAGKWRRQITIPSVAECTDTPITDADQTRLPKSSLEGDIPKIALATGGADPLECLLRKIGVVDDEFGGAGSAARVHLYQGAGGAGSFASGTKMTAATTLWGKVDTLKTYDLVLLACEGDQNPGEKPAAALQAMFDYTTIGGRVFASHWHNYWLEKGPAPWPNTAEFDHQPDLADPFTAKIDTTFPKGSALAEWLVNVGGSKTKGSLVIKAAQHTVNGVKPGTQRWIYSDTPNSTQYFTFNTPIGVKPEDQCGRVVFSDIHVSSGDTVGKPFPNGCTTKDLSPQEKALEFMLFDLSSRVCDDKAPPEPPPR